MDEQTDPFSNESIADPAERSLVTDVRQLVADGQVMLEAELAYHKSRALVAGAGARGILVWALLALALVIGAILALVIGVLIALGPYLTPWGSTLAVVIGLLVLAGAAAWASVRRWRRVRNLLSNGEGP